MEKLDPRLEQLALEHQTMRALLQCPVCLEMLINPARTKCGHIFCKACIEDCLAKRGKRGRVACPSCQVQGVTKRSLETDRTMAELVVEVRRLLHAEKEDTSGDINFLEIRVVKEGSRESTGTPTRTAAGGGRERKLEAAVPVAGGGGGGLDMLDMIGSDSEGSVGGGRRGLKRKGDASDPSSPLIIMNISDDLSEKDKTSLANQSNAGISVKRKLARRKKEPLVVSTIKQAWNKEKGKQRKTYSKAPSTPSEENISRLGSQVLPGEELSGDEEYWHERRERNLPRVDTVSKTDQVGRWLGDTSTGEYMDLASQPNPSQSSVSTPSNRSFLPPREVPDISPLDRGTTRPVPLSPLDTNTLDLPTNTAGVHIKIKTQNQLWDKMTGKLALTSSPRSLETSDLSSSTTMSQVMPSSCQVDINNTFDNLVQPITKKSIAPKIAKSAQPPPSPGMFCSQMSSLDDSLPMLLSPGISINIIKSLESDSGSGEEATVRENAGVGKGRVPVKDRSKDVEKVTPSDPGKSVTNVASVSLSVLLADDPVEIKGKGKKKVSWGDSGVKKSTWKKSLVDEKKSPGWSKIGLAIGEMEASVPQVGGKYPALNISNLSKNNKEESEEAIDIEPVDSIELEDSNIQHEKEEAPLGGETDTDSFPSVISASVCSGEEKSYRVLSALCHASPGRHGGWGTQEAGMGKETVEKVGRLVELEEEGLASHEAEIARLGSGSSGRKSFQLDVSTCELERISLPQDTMEMVASMGEGDDKENKQSPRVTKLKCIVPVLPVFKAVTADTITDKFVKPSPKVSTTKGMKVSFSLVGRVSSSVSKPKRDKVVHFLQLGRLATQTPTTSSMPSLRDILAKTSSCVSDLGDPDRTPQPRQSVAQWLKYLHTPDSIDSIATPLFGKKGSREVETTVDMEVQTSQSLVEGMKKHVGFDEREQSVNGHSFVGEELEAKEVKENDNLEDVESQAGVDNSSSSVDTLEQRLQGDTNEQYVTDDDNVEIESALTKNCKLTSSPAPTLSTLLQTHLANVSPAPPLSFRPNAKLGRKKAKPGQGNPYLDPTPGTSGTNKKQTRAQARDAKEREVGQLSRSRSINKVPEPPIEVDEWKDMNGVIDVEEASQVASSCPDSQIGHPWVLNMAEESSELPDIDKYARDGVHQPFMAEILGREVGLYSQDKETREEELDRVARIQFEDENCRMDSPVRKRGRMDDSDEDSPAKVSRKKVRKIESDDDDESSQEVEMIPSGKKDSSRSSVQKTPRGTSFHNTFQAEPVEKMLPSTCSQVIDVIDSQEGENDDKDGWTEEDMELPVVDQPVSQVTQSKSLLDSPCIPANLSRSSSVSSLTSDSEPDQRTTQEIKRDLALAEVRASKLRSDMDINVEVLGSQAFFQEMTNNRHVVDTTMSTIPETESMGLNDAREILETEPLLHETEDVDPDDNGNESKILIPETELVSEAAETETIMRETEPVVDETEHIVNNVTEGNYKTEVHTETEAQNNTTVPDSDDDLFSQTPEDSKPKPSAGVKVLSPVLEAGVQETSQVIKPTSKVVTVDTSNWKFVTSNLIPAVRKVVPQFIASLQCKGIGGKVDDSVTHIIVSTGEELEAQRTLKYLQGVASGVMIVSHLWVEACMLDRNNVSRADMWEVTDEELMGANGPWRARKRREEGREPILSGYQVLIEGQLDGLDKSSVEDLLDRAGARAVPDKNAFSYTAEVTRLVLVDSTAVVGAKLVGKMLRTYKLAMVDKDWLLDTIGGHCVRPILNYTLDTVQREDLKRVGYTGALVE